MFEKGIMRVDATAPANCARHVWESVVSPTPTRAASHRCRCDVACCPGYRSIPSSDLPSSRRCHVVQETNCFPRHFVLHRWGHRPIYQALHPE
ncbi:uncharacterized protein LOC144103226 isoform X4 [Amblyomma americanum]